MRLHACYEAKQQLTNHIIANNGIRYIRLRGKHHSNKVHFESNSSFSYNRYQYNFGFVIGYSKRGLARKLKQHKELF